MKSALYDEFNVEDEYEFSSTKAFVVDDGYLLQAVTWNKNICNITLDFHTVSKLSDKQFHAG